MPRAMSVSFTFAGERHQDVVLEYGGFAPPDGEGGSWMIEVPALLRLLSAAERGEASVAEVRTMLLRAIGKFSERSGCCPDCEAAIDSYARALEEYQAAAEELSRQEAATTPDSHPYVVSSSGKIHRRDSAATRRGSPSNIRARRYRSMCTTAGPTTAPPTTCAPQAALSG
jgi:hypothetical protein